MTVLSSALHSAENSAGRLRSRCGWAVASSQLCRLFSMDEMMLSWVAMRSSTYCASRSCGGVS